MAKKRSKSTSPPRSAELTADDIRKGLKKLDRRIQDLEQFDVQVIEERGDAQTRALREKINGTIRDIFGHDTVEYRQYSVSDLDTLPIIVNGPRHPLSRVQEGYQKGIDRALVSLRGLRETLQEKLDDMDDDAEMLPETERLETGSNRVFVVRGHDDAAKEQVARFLTKLDLEPIILHEQPSGGRTIVEKLEAHSAVAFALVLLTPDDIGHPKDQPENASLRARQNVILELGLFLGALGRSRVCALYKGDDMEIPTDYQGVIYVPMDGSWQLVVAREMKHTGVDIDLNKAIS